MDPRALLANVAGGPVLFWIRGTDQMVVRQQGEVGHRHPASDDVQWQRHDVRVRQIEVNGAIDDETFVFRPPAGRRRCQPADAASR